MVENVEVLEGGKDAVRDDILCFFTSHDLFVDGIYSGACCLICTFQD